MSPLGASLAFIIISILISVAKHFIFPSSTPTSSEESSIEMRKLYTITDKRSQKQTKSYSSFYEAYHQFHLSEVEEQKHRIQAKFMKQYNSLVMKKSIINDQFTIICDQNYLITVSEGLNCQQSLNITSNINQKPRQCIWQTQFSVYELPLLKQQTKQTISVQGRIGLSSKDPVQQALRQNLKCKKIPNTKKYIVSFALSNKNLTINEKTWTLNKLFIAKSQEYDQNDKKSDKLSKGQKHKNNKAKKVQAKRYDSIKENIPLKKASNQSYQLDIQSFNLQQSSHIPSVFYSNQESISYATEDEPWLIRYNIDNQWKQLNILQKSIQDKLYEDLSYSSRIPPFQRNEKIIVKDIFLLKAREDIYPIDCNDKDQRNDCNEKIKTKQKNYLTVVYLHINNQYRVEKFYVQLTFELEEQISTQNQNQNKEKVKQSESSQEKTESSSSMLIGYSLLISQINPAREIHSDCSINPKTQNIIERHFDKYYWLYENKLISSLQTHSLLCVFRFQIDQHLRVVQIRDLIHSTQKNKNSQLSFLDWKSLKKIINYKESYEKQTLLKHLSTSNSNHQLSQYNTRNKTQLNDEQFDSTKAKQSKNKNSQNQDRQIDIYLQILKEEFQSPKKSQSKTEKDQKDKDNNTKKKSKKGQKKSKSDKNSKKKKKIKSESNTKDSMTLVEGQHKPTVETSFNYSFIRKTVFPHRSEVIKYKFPLPFLLSFTQNMQIVDSDPQKPMILFSGVKQFLFTYKHKPQSENSTYVSKVVDYRYLTLGPTYKYSSKLFAQTEGTPQHQIQTVKGVLSSIIGSEKTNQKLTVEIKDETHPQVQNVLKTMYEADESILNQVKSIKSIPVEVKKKYPMNTDEQQMPQTYQKYLIVVWGWGIQVYLVDWDKNGFLRQQITQQEIETQLSKKNSSLIEYFFPFIELFATFYCMFQALISSR